MKDKAKWRLKDDVRALRRVERIKQNTKRLNLALTEIHRATTTNDAVITYYDA